MGGKNVNRPPGGNGRFGLPAGPVPLIGQQPQPVVVSHNEFIGDKVLSGPMHRVVGGVLLVAGNKAQVLGGKSLLLDTAAPIYAQMVAPALAGDENDVALTEKCVQAAQRSLAAASILLDMEWQVRTGTAQQSQEAEGAKPAESGSNPSAKPSESAPATSESKPDSPIIVTGD